MGLFEPLFEALNAAGVRYVVVGGLATVLHGFARFTGDVDLIVDLDPSQARNAVEVLAGLGFRPRLPVDALGFADTETRMAWIRDKGMRVFSLWDPADPMREVDLFVEHPIPFAELWERAEMLPLAKTAVRVASIPDLVALKRLAGRPQDLRDIEVLQQIAQGRRDGNGDA